MDRTMSAGLCPSTCMQMFEGVKRHNEIGNTRLMLNAYLIPLAALVPIIFGHCVLLCLSLFFSSSILLLLLLSDANVQLVNVCIWVAFEHAFKYNRTARKNFRKVCVSIFVGHLNVIVM